MDDEQQRMEAWRVAYAMRSSERGVRWSLYGVERMKGSVVVVVGGVA